jgi:hypothetical protein
MGAVLMLLGELGFIAIFIGGGTLIELPIMTMHYSDIPEWGALLSNIRYQARSYPWTGFYPMLAFFIAILSFNLLGEGIRRLVEQGNPLLNKIVNRYTVILLLLAVFGYNYVSANSGAIPFYRQHAEGFSGENTMEHLMVLVDQRIQGRALGSENTDLAAYYIANQFENLGLQSAGESSSYFQTRNHSFERIDSIPLFDINDGASVPIFHQDYAAYPGRNMSLGEAETTIRILTLGERSTATGFRTAYPDLFKADFSGEILMVFSDREAWTLSGLPADGLIVVTEDPTELQRRYTFAGRSNTNFTFSGMESGGDIPAIWITEEMADRILQGSEHSVESIRKMAKELSIEEVVQIPVQIGVQMKVEGTLEERWPVKHVLGHIPGKSGMQGCQDCLGNHLIVVMAQYDSPPVGPEGVYQHANDNASGVAVMLEAIRIMQETEYQPYKSFLFIAFSGEGLDGGEYVFDPDVNSFLQAKTGFTNFDIEAIVHLRGVGSGQGDRIEISAGGSLRLAELFEEAAQQMGVETVRKDEGIDMNLIYNTSNPFLQGGVEAPVVRMFWDGWEEDSIMPTDTYQNIRVKNLTDAGKTLSMALMILGRETQY